MSRRPQSFVSAWTQAFRDSVSPGGPARVTGYALATFANADGSSVRPGMARLMLATDLGRSTLRRALPALIGDGWLVEVTPGTTGRATEYRLTLPPDVSERVKAGRLLVEQHRAERSELDSKRTAERRDRRERERARAHGWDTP